MIRRLLILLPALWGALDLGAAGRLHAAAAPCPAVLVEADAATLDRWPDLPEQVRQAFAGRDDVDRCARVRLTLVDGAIALQVSLPDGRSTARLVQRPDVIAHLEALLLVPAPEPPPRAPAAPAIQATTARLEPTVLAVRGAAGPTRHFAAELSLGASLHAGDGQTSTSLGARALLEAAGWLVGFGARIDRYQPTAGETADSPGALEVGALVGRRLRRGRFLFDVAGGPAVALRGSWSVMSANRGSTTPVSSSWSDNALVPRWILDGRLTLGARSTLRAFVGIEGELGAGGPIPPGQVRGLPQWSVGGALGVTVGTL